MSIIKSKDYDDTKTVPEVVIDYSEELDRVVQDPELLKTELYTESNSEKSGYINERHHYSSTQHRHHHRSSYHTSATGGGRLASHHRSRHHRHKTNDSYEGSINPELAEKEFSEIKKTEVLKEHNDSRIKQSEKNFQSNNDEIKKREPTKRIASKAAGSESEKRAAERRKPKSKSTRRNNSRRRKKIGVFGVLIRILVFFIVVGIAGIGTLFYLRERGRRAMTGGDVEITIPEDNPDVEGVEDNGKIIIYKGEKYRYNEGVSTILFLGTDRTVKQQQKSENVVGRNGQADTILMAVVDNTNKKIQFININRDTMTMVSEYTPDNDYAGEKEMQICLAYAYGEDNEQSCERMATAVSKFLYGIPVKAYCRLSYDGIPVLNDAVGGVTVKVLEDMTSTEAEWKKGTKITLKGKQATTYVRWRNKGTVHTNELRMERQKQYLNAYMKRTIAQTRKDFTLPISLYSTAKGYMSSDITAPKLTYLTSKVLEYGINKKAIVSIAGESVDGENNVEYNVDDTALFETILAIFYNKI